MDEHDWLAERFEADRTHLRRERMSELDVTVLGT